MSIKNTFKNQEIQNQSNSINNLLQYSKNTKEEYKIQPESNQNEEKKSELSKQRDDVEKKGNQNHVTFIQQNIFCSTEKAKNIIDDYSFKNSNAIAQNTKFNPDDSHIMRPDEEEQVKVLNTYFSELKDPNSQSAQSELLNIKSFLLHTKKNKITSVTDSNGIVSSYSAYIYKNQKQYNEDRMKIATFNVENHNVAFYCIYDGHGGTESADLLNESLHLNIINNKMLFTDKNNALLTEINKIEEQLTNDFLNKNKNKKKKKFKSSGSCVLTLMIIDDIINVIHVGDSRGIISMNNGQSIYSLTSDHHPSLESEKIRILSNGGDIKYDNRSKNSKTQRVFPGGLAISRSIGDIEAKLPPYGGKPNVIISTPDIISFKLQKDFDFIVLCCDGISSKVSNREICLIVYQTLSKCIDKIFSYDQLIQKCSINIMKEAIMKGSKDNLTCIFICFDSFKKLFVTRNKNQIEDSIRHLNNSIINCENLYHDLESEYIVNKDSKLKITTQKTGMNFKQKSILNSNNIQFETSELSFQESNISLEGKRSGSKKEEHKKKKIKSTFFCCGIFS